MNLTLRPVIDADLPLFFEHQLDPIASHMAAFTRKDPKDRAAFDTHWSKIRSSPDITIRTILLDNTVAGHVATTHDVRCRENHLLDRPRILGKGIATAALKIFLRRTSPAPLRPAYRRGTISRIDPRADEMRIRK